MCQDLTLNLSYRHSSSFYSRLVSMATDDKKMITVNSLKFRTLSNKLLVIRAGIYKMLVRIANR